MNVLMSADTIGGVWTYALELADALADHDVAVTLATMGAPPSSDQREQLRHSRVAAVHESTYALEWMPDPWDDVARAGEWLLELAEDVDPDVVHVNGYAHAAVACEVPVVLVAHSDVLSWWRAVKGEPARTEWNTYRNAVEQGLAHADLVVAPSRAVLADLAREYAFAGDALVVPNGRRPLPRQSKEPYVAAVGRFWDEAKNLSALRRVAPRLPWPLHVAGADAPLPRAAVDDLLARASIFAAPARYEPFGLAALEAATAGCALVLGDIASYREVWGDAALYVAPDDDEALRAAITTLVEDERLRRDYARRAAARATRYTPARMADAYVSVYRSLGARVAA